MAMSMAGGGPSGPEMNVTPLIDVLLVLIIIFMIVVTQEKETGLKTQIPQPANEQQSVPQPRTIVIRVMSAAGKQDPELKINDENVKWSDLSDRLQQIFKWRAERVAFVQGEDDVEFQWVAEVIDTARHAGVEKVGLLPKELASAR
ncbi:MAG TPA: biopolymer transporter ExbD [Terriglobales bacterium]|jgi:biopolymer transport protein TolR|nr:biopolymer transporter ExbD [Terriglobales bacterium]